MIPASDPRSPIPCRFTVARTAALHVAVDQANRLVVVRLAAEPDARLSLAPEQARILGALLTGAAGSLLGGRAMSPRVGILVWLAGVGLAASLPVGSLEAELDAIHARLDRHEAALRALASLFDLPAPAVLPAP